MHTFIQQECFKLIKSDSKYIYNVAKYFYVNKCCSFQLYLSENPEKGVFNID